MIFDWPCARCQQNGSVFRSQHLRNPASEVSDASKTVCCSTALGNFFALGHLHNESPESKFFPFRESTLQKGDKTILMELPPLKVYQIPLLLLFVWTCQSPFLGKLRNKISWSYYLMNLICPVVKLTHSSLASYKRDIGKQCISRSDAAERGVWSGSTLFALSSGISTKHDNNNWEDSPYIGKRTC